MKPAPLMWSDSQRHAFEELAMVGETFFHADWLSLPLRPRFDSLIIGPTGAGKSHLVRAVAAHLDAPCLRVSHGEWIVLGARSHVQATVQKIGKFILENERGIIHVDELDKARAGFRAEWSIAVFAEIFSLLDRMVPAGPWSGSWDETQIRRLRQDFWFVGSGTWQSVWERSASIGFAHQKPASDPGWLSKKIRSAGFIPTELLNRFSDAFVFLEPATEKDFRHAAEIFELTKLARALGEEIDFIQATEDGLGARWLEKIQADLLIKAWKRGRQDLLPIRIREEDGPPEVDPDNDMPL